MDFPGAIAIPMWAAGMRSAFCSVDAQPIPTRLILTLISRDSDTEDQPTGMEPGCCCAMDDFVSAGPCAAGEADACSTCSKFTRAKVGDQAQGRPSGWPDGQRRVLLQPSPITHAELRVKRPARHRETLPLTLLLAMPRPKDVPPDSAALRDPGCSRDHFAEQLSSGEELLADGRFASRSRSRKKLAARPGAGARDYHFAARAQSKNAFKPLSKTGFPGISPILAWRS